MQKRKGGQEVRFARENGCMRNTSGAAMPDTFRLPVRCHWRGGRSKHRLCSEAPFRALRDGLALPPLEQPARVERSLVASSFSCGATAKKLEPP